MLNAFFYYVAKSDVDRDLADMYGVDIEMLNQAVVRNQQGFAQDFKFQLSHDEWKGLSHSL